MTLTKKVGAILLLLTAGSLAGTAAFAIFFARTSSDLMFLVATNAKQTMLQQLTIDALSIRTGDDSARASLQGSIDSFSSLSDALVSGGTRTASGNQQSLLKLTDQVYAIVVNPSMSTSYSVERLAKLLSEELPVPPANIRDASVEFAEEWNKSRPDFQYVATHRVDEPMALAAYARIRENSAGLNQKSRKITAVVGQRIVQQRNNLLSLLVSIAGLSLFLFGIGLWFNKRYVTTPIHELQIASTRMRQGDFSYRIPETVSNDEVAALSKTFNEMSAEINRLIERYRELFENAADFIYTTDLEGNFLSVNKAGENITGFSRGELQVMRSDQIVDARSVSTLNQMRDQLLSGKQHTAVAEVEFVTRNGSHLFMDTIKRLIYENGKPIAVQVVARDITERRKLQEQLWTAQKMEAIGRMASGIAHDFGNVLTIITGYCALILATRPADDPVCGEVKGIQSAAQRAAALIRHLLGFSSGQVFRPKVILPEAALREMIDMLRRLIGEDIQLVTDIPKDLRPIRIDPGQLEQIVINLVLNARDSMPGGGVLKILAVNEETPAPHVRIRIADTGIGMTPETMSKIFEPFFTTKGHGTGLGLSTVHSIVRQSDGTISVESQPGEGSTFSLSFPRVSEAAEADGVTPVPVPQRGTETILLVEDETGVRQLIRDMLRFYGYNVVEAEDQRQAIEFCSRHDLKLDLLLTDVLMPGMSGPEMVKQMIPMRPDMKIIYMSGHSRDRFATTGLNLETDNFIQKPVLTEVLTSRIRSALENKPGGSQDASTAG